MSVGGAGRSQRVMGVAMSAPMTRSSLRHRFPGASTGWARFDGPAGTQMVDSAIEAAAAWMASGSSACGGGTFAASKHTDALVDRTRDVVGQFLHADPAGVCFGPNMTSITFAISRAIGATLRAGDRVVGTRLDHDANVAPWRLACEQAGATHVLAEIDAATGTLPSSNVIDLIDDRTRWVTLPGASNLLGTIPDHAPIIDAAHAVGARVFIDAVHLAPHMPIDITTLDCDALVTSPYKWYAPHSGVLWMRPEMIDELPMFKVRPSPSEGPGRFETGMPNYEAIAGIEAAARFLIEEGMDQVAAAEAEVFAPLLSGLQEIAGVTVYGHQGLDHRTPTAAFRIDGVTPAAAAEAMAAAEIALWAGHNYAVELVAALGLADSGGVIRAGISRYVDLDDVERLLAVVRRLAGA